MTIHMLNPFLAATLACTGWVVLLFWATSAIIADENTRNNYDDGEKRVRRGFDEDGGDQGDGRQAASSVARVWERWVGQGRLWRR